MSIDWEALSTGVAIFVAFLAVLAMLIESRRHRFALGVDLLMKLDDQFDAPRMHANRRQAAESFEKNELAISELNEILNFYEVMAYLVRRGALDKHAVWVCFFSYLYRLRHYADEHIENKRRADPTLWTELLWLYDELMKFEAQDRQRRGAELGLSDHDFKIFLQEETRLKIPSRGRVDDNSE